MTARESLEQIRFGWERDLESVVQPFLVDSDEAEDPSSDHDTMLLSEYSAPRVYRLAREVAETLGCDRPFVVYQTRSMRELNAQAIRQNGPYAVRLIGPVVSLLDDDALKAMIGHELGHCMAHGRRRPNRLSNGSAVRQALSIASELTADRMGLIGCRDLRAAVRLEIATATGVTVAALGLKELEHLAEVCARVEAGDALLVDNTHPSRDFRLYALWLFSRSDVCRRLMPGDLPAELTVSDVDAKLTKMLLTPSLERAIVAVREEPERRARIAERKAKKGARQKAKEEAQRQAAEPPPKPPSQKSSARPVGAAEEPGTQLGSRMLGEARALARRFLGRQPVDEANAAAPVPDAGEVVEHDMERRFLELEAKASDAERERLLELERRFDKLEKGS